MRLVARWDELKTSRVTHLSIRQALELLSDKPDEPAEETPTETRDVRLWRDDETPKPPRLQSPAAEMFGLPVWFEERGETPAPTDDPPPPEKSAHRSWALLKQPLRSASYFKS